MSITAEAVKQLRERTGAGMMECKKALVETNGDLDAAAELMRKQGLAKADKKAARVAAEGVIALEKAGDGHSAAIVEINCETDFVAREADFYGAMDGASKFVKGDAIAGLVIVAINLLAGMAIGVMQQGMGFSEAISHFSILTVGDEIGRAHV